MKVMVYLVAPHLKPHIHDISRGRMKGSQQYLNKQKKNLLHNFKSLKMM